MAETQVKASQAKVGVLMVNLGTPDEPTPGALRRYLRQFLSDQRVVDYPRWLWFPVLYGIILNTRPPKVAKLYRRIWTDEGSPLLVYTRNQAAALQARLGEQYQVVYGMRYGNPSVAAAVQQLTDAGIQKILVFPMFPQFSSSTVASVYDEVLRVTVGQPGAFYTGNTYDIPTLRFVPPYYDHPGYIDALRARVCEQVAADGEPEHYIFTFHGVPQRFINSGEPYQEQCGETAQLLAASLGLDDNRWTLSFQSQFGPEKWIGPDTEETLEALGENGIKHVLAACPGFVADCLETIDEIGTEAAEAFEESGGEHLSFAPCVNDHALFIDAMEDIVRQETAGWVKAASPEPAYQNGSKRAAPRFTN